MRRVLVLGAGLVVKPLLEDLLSLSDVEVHLAALNIDRANALVSGHQRATALEINALDEAQLLPEVRQAAVVISLLPADQHTRIAEACVAHRVPLITTSYASAEMRDLHAAARARGVLLLNECGLDPGIDHITAVRVIRRVEREGGAIRSFASYCGGLPAPQSNNNPWGYKFSWSPRGVVMAARRPVAYLENGAIVRREFPDLFEGPRYLDIPGVGQLETYPNRDCLRYIAQYGVWDARDFFRGTLRYRGWCETWQALYDLGLLDMAEREWLDMTYADFLAAHLPPGEGGLVTRLASTLKIGVDNDVIARLEWLGLLSDRPVPETRAASLDVVANRLQEKLAYKEGERDMVLLEHHFIAVRPDRSERRMITRMQVIGVAGNDSAMARTVSYPAAIACRLILDGRITLTGVHIPVARELTDPIMLGLTRRGVHITEVDEDIG